MYCGNCGAEIQEKIKFCPMCGCEIEYLQQNSQKKRSMIISMNEKFTLKFNLIVWIFLCVNVGQIVINKSSKFMNIMRTYTNSINAYIVIFYGMMLGILIFTIIEFVRSREKEANAGSIK